MTTSELTGGVSAQGDLTASEVNVAGSLRRKLVFSLIGGAAVLTLVLFFAIRHYATQIAQQSQDNILRASVTSLLDAVSSRNGQVIVDIPYAAFSMLSTSGDDRVFYAVYYNEQLLTGYDDLSAQAASESDTSFQSVRYNDASVRQVTATRILTDASRQIPVTATIAQTQDNLSGTLNQISRTATIFGGGFFILAVLLSAWATNAAIGPLQRLADSIARRGPQDLSPVAKPVPAEMQPLVESLNHLMARLENSLKQSEDFIAEAAHRVRTPIATVRSHAEMTLQRVDKEENRQALRSMIRAIDETSRAAGQLLDHAMITFRTGQLERQTVNLTSLVEDSITRLSPVAELKDVELKLHSNETVVVTGDGISIQNAVRNLLDNALKYSPSESSVLIKVGNDPQPYVEVNDQGPGFPEEEIDALTTRFKRGGNVGAVVGSGLGLTIAEDVAVAHQGELKIYNNEKGGACATLFFQTAH